MSLMQDIENINLSPEEINKLKGMVSEAVNSHYRRDAEKELLSDIGTRAKDELKIPKKLFNALVTTAYKNDGDKKNAELSAVLELAHKLGYYSEEGEG